jgi:hypothetical protein
MNREFWSIQASGENNLVSHSLSGSHTKQSMFILEPICSILFFCFFLIDIYIYIRLIEPKLWDGYDPNHKTMIQEVVLNQDMKPLEVSKEDAETFKHAHGDKVDVWETESGQWMAKFKKGALFYIPKALRFDRLVAGQIPTGWDPKRYGIPEQIIQQVDPCTLYTLVSTVEALVSAGITDPYEFYQYVHLAEVGNTIGSGFGGVRSMQKVFKERFKCKSVQQDILQETFINTIPAWINMLLLG